MDKENHLIIIHTFGLGDIIMASGAIDKIKDEGYEYSIFVKEKSVFDYLKHKGHPVILGGPFHALLNSLSLKFKNKTNQIIRTTGGTELKNKLFKFLASLLLIKFSYSFLGISNNNLHRREENIFILEEALKRKIKFNEDTKSNLFEKESQKEQLLLNDDLPIAFHFGFGDKLRKSLEEKKIREIISTYRKKYPKNTFIQIIGPREKKSMAEEFDQVWDSLSISELIESSNSISLCVCNDTGIGHLLGKEGVPVDLWINSDSKAIIEKVYPENLRNLRRI